MLIERLVGVVALVATALYRKAFTGQSISTWRLGQYADIPVKMPADTDHLICPKSNGRWGRINVWPHGRCGNVSLGTAQILPDAMYRLASDRPILVGAPHS